MKIAVIGVGGVGSAACRFATCAGHRVIGFEQFHIGHTRGSSHGESRIIRYTYPDLLYTRMMGRAYPLWADLQREAGEELFVRSGGLLFGRPENIRESREALEAAGLRFEILGPEETMGRFPAFSLNKDEVALFQRDSGFLRSSRCVLANARLATERGAELREGTAVLGMVPHGVGVVVRTAAGEEWFDRAIVTAGAWMGRFLAQAGLPLRVEQRQFIYVNIARDAAQFQPERMPIWIDADALYYGFPSDGQVQGVKLASHVNGMPFDPAEKDRPLIAEYVDEALVYAAKRLPDTGGEIVRGGACLYTMTPDEDFIIDRAPGLDNIWLCSACSGHGFKFTVLLGQLMADLATGGSASFPLDRFSVRRFAS